jgi:hypothetical protein
MLGNVRARGLQTASFPEICLSALQLDRANVSLVVRSAVAPA